MEKLLSYNYEVVHHDLVAWTIKLHNDTITVSIVGGALCHTLLICFAEPAVVPKD